MNKRFKYFVYDMGKPVLYVHNELTNKWGFKIPIYRLIRYERIKSLRHINYNIIVNYIISNYTIYRN